MGHLNGKSIVITGGGRGLGAAYAEAALREGARVLLNDIDADPAHETADRLAALGEVEVHVGDVGDWDTAGALVAKCVARFGRIDGLVNNAGLLALSLIPEQDEASLRRLVATNLLGQAFCGSHALREMLAQGSGAVVNINSGAQAGLPFRAGYSAVSAGIAALTYAWAVECAGTGVRANAFAPIADTRETASSEPFFDRLHAMGRMGGNLPAMRATMKALTPAMNAPIVVYLLSDAAAAVTGQGLRFTGRDLMLMAHPAVKSPMQQSDAWTFEAVRAAFEGPWRDNLADLGLVEATVETVRKL